MPAVDRVTYTLYFQKGGSLYQLAPICTELKLSEKKDELAQTLTFKLANVKVGDTYIGSLLDPGDIIHLTCNDGDGRKGELFRGPVWETEYEHGKRTYSCTAYDPLIYLNKSKDLLFFQKGRTTQQIFESVCGDWNIPLSYTYTSIQHEQVGNTLAVQIADFLVERLHEVREKTHLQYTLKYENQKMVVCYRGNNSIVYTLSDDTNLTASSLSRTMDDMLTQVVITGPSDDSDSAPPVEATLHGENQTHYGTIQSYVARNEDDTLAKIKEEQQQTLWEKRLPSKTFSATSIDYPFMRVGDIVKYNTGSNAGWNRLCVKSVTHDLLNRSMQLELET